FPIHAWSHRVDRPALGDSQSRSATAEQASPSTEQFWLSLDSPRFARRLLRRTFVDECCKSFNFGFFQFEIWHLRRLYARIGQKFPQIIGRRTPGCEIESCIGDAPRVHLDVPVTTRAAFRREEAYTFRRKGEWRRTFGVRANDSESRQCRRAVIETAHN